MNNGYLTIEASRKYEHDDEKDGKLVRSERFYGSTKRAFYIGDVRLEDIKGTFEDGILKLIVPKESKQIVETKYLELS